MKIFSQCRTYRTAPVIAIVYGIPADDPVKSNRQRNVFPNDTALLNVNGEPQVPCQLSGRKSGRIVGNFHFSLSQKDQIIEKSETMKKNKIPL